LKKVIVTEMSLYALIIKIVKSESVLRVKNARVKGKMLIRQYQITPEIIEVRIICLIFGAYQLTPNNK
jgi:hypothetical protein